MDIWRCERLSGGSGIRHDLGHHPREEVHIQKHEQRIAPQGIQLFSVMMRGTKTMAIMGTFFGLSPRSLLQLTQLLT